jgi:hypothetical protein
LVDQSDQDEATQFEFIPLPKSFTILPGDIDFGRDHIRLNKHLEKDKKVAVGAFICDNPNCVSGGDLNTCFINQSINNSLNYGLAQCLLFLFNLN